MRKVKFTQDSFDEKLGAILTEFPVLDVRIFAFDWVKESGADWDCVELAPVFGVAYECVVRQEPLQARAGSAAHGEALDRPGREGLRPSAQVWR